MDTTAPGVAHTCPLPSEASSADLIHFARVSDAAWEALGPERPADAGERLDYQRLWRAAAKKKFEIVRKGGRIYVRRSDLPAVLAAVGLASVSSSAA